MSTRLEQEDDYRALGPGRRVPLVTLGQLAEARGQAAAPALLAALKERCSSAFARPQGNGEVEMAPEAWSALQAQAAAEPDLAAAMRAARCQADGNGRWYLRCLAREAFRRREFELLRLAGGADADVDEVFQVLVLAQCAGIELVSTTPKEGTQNG